MGHPLGDDLAVADFGIDRLQYEGDFLMYDRAAQRNIIPPQMYRRSDLSVDYDYPAGYIKSGMPTVKFGLDVPNLNNLQASYRFQIWFAGENYYFETLLQSLQGDLNNVVTCPQLPDYVYAHHFRIVIQIWFWFPNDQMWVPYSSWDYNPVSAPPALDWTNYWYAVFSDPNATFPRYKYGGSGIFQTVPWYQIVENALNHVTTSGVDQTVIDPGIALANLTTDLYVWPNRLTDGPASSHYRPASPLYYLPDPPPPAPPTAVIFDLWGMRGATNGDCQDFSSYLQCQARSIGIRGMMSKRLGSNFGCHPLLFCGDPLPLWTNTGFTFHQIGWRSGTDKFYDWAFAFQHDSSPWWKLCIEYTENDEKNALVLPGFSTTFGTAFALGDDNDPDYGVETYIK